MPYYLAVHYEPGESRETITSRWICLALERRATWMKTWFNFPRGKRFCWWDAPSKSALEEVFHDYGIPWEQIMEVEHTTAAEWRWRED